MSRAALAELQSDPIKTRCRDLDADFAAYACPSPTPCLLGVLGLKTSNLVPGLDDGMHSMPRSTMTSNRSMVESR